MPVEFLKDPRLLDRNFTFRSLNERSWVDIDEFMR